MSPLVRLVLLVFLWAVATELSVAQATLRLPLPVDSLQGASSFDCPAPPAAVLTGILWPASGPLTSWAPVFSTLEADGTLKEAQAGGWVGKRPDRWLKIVRPGFVVAGFRVLVRTGPSPLQTRQAQVFWKPWVDGQPQGGLQESSVHGAPAEAKDTVRIIELRLPEGAIPTGLYGETVGGAVAQASLTVRQNPGIPAQSAPGEADASAGPQAPTAPVLDPLAPVHLRGISQEQR